MRLYPALRRIHVWLGWLVGVPLLLWTASGLFMALQPIERVRGEHLVREAPMLSPGPAPVPPIIGPRPMRSLTLEQQHDGPVWVIRYRDGEGRRADPGTGRLLPKLSPGDAAANVRLRYTGGSQIAAVERIPADRPPVELRRKVESFRVGLRDGTTFYVDAATGEILARRTAQWRAYDLLWGLHIMDLKQRTDFNHPLLIFFAAISLLSILVALTLLPFASRWRK
jgi:hypothetical protein